MRARRGSAVRRRGLSQVVLDKGSVASTITQYPTYATFFSTAEKLSIGGMPFMIANEKPTRREALAYYRAVVTHLTTRVRQYETVTAIEPSGAATSSCGQSRRRAKRARHAHARS